MSEGKGIFGITQGLRSGSEGRGEGIGIGMGTGRFAWLCGLFCLPRRYGTTKKIMWEKIRIERYK